MKLTRIRRTRVARPPFYADGSNLIIAIVALGAIAVTLIFFPIP